jgi:FixJ family two-component response regulator
LLCTARRQRESRRPKGGQIVALIEDDASFRRSTERLLRLGGFQVQSFNSAAEFLKSKRPEGATCLVLDVRLPGLSGLDLQRKLNAAGVEVPIVFITGHGDIPMSVRAMKEGAAEFLTKPFRDEDLLNAIRQAVERVAARKRQTKPLLKLHGAIDLDSLWKAVQLVIESVIPDSFVGLTLQHNPVMPMVSRWSRPIADGMFNSKPIEEFLEVHPRSKFVQVDDVFPLESKLLKSDFYEQYMATEKLRYGIGIFFWNGSKLVCVVVVMRNIKQGELTGKQIALLRELYPQFQIALRRLGLLERDQGARIALQEFLSRLPLPTILLRWNSSVAYQNRAAREFCAVWERGPKLASALKTTASIPGEILDCCRSLGQRWEKLSRRATSQPLPSETVHHPKWPHLRATVSLKQLGAAVARPQFLIECEELRTRTESDQDQWRKRLSHLARLTAREQQVVVLVCEGRSNMEIADDVHLSLPMVKKHLHAIFRKLEVSSRSRLMALLA